MIAPEALREFALIAGRRAPRIIALVDAPSASALRDRLPNATFRELTSGALGGPETADARFDLVVTEVDDGSDTILLATWARRALARRGRLVAACAISAMPELLAALSATGLVPKRLQLVHPDRAAPADLALVQAISAKPGGLVVEAPLFRSP